MTEFELQILREEAGELRPTPWGSAVGAALGSLKAKGYITSIFRGTITEAGRQALAEAKQMRAEAS